MTPHNDKDNDNECTPSWKVNLTQKFNQFCKTTKNAHNQRRKILSFQDELEQQLKSIPVHREQLSSHKKYHMLREDTQEVNTKSNKTSDLKILQQKHKQPQQSQNQSKRQIHINQKSQLHQKSPKIQKLHFDSGSKHQQSGQESFSLFTNKKVAKLFKQYFNHRQSIQLKEFVDMCCIEFLKHQSLSSQVKEIMLNECRQIFCTTDQNFISLNALELITKKSDLQVVTVEKYLHSKYKKKKRDLEKQYEDILVEILNQQENLKEQHDKLTKNKKELQTKEKQLLKRQKNIKSQEKQLIEKDKLIKKTLQDKHTKLMTELNHQFQSLTKQLQKKSNALERNARNKLQLLEKRSNDFKVDKLKHYIPEKDSDDQGSKKLNNQILLLKGKLRKVEKQFETQISDKIKEIKHLEAESNSFLKANTLLENKLQKSKAKSKEINEIVTRQALQLEEARRQLDQKAQRIVALQNFALQFEHQQQKIKLKQSSKPHKQQKSNPKADSKSQHKQGQRHNVKEHSQNSKKVVTQNTKQILQKIDTLLGLILKGFESQVPSQKSQARQVIKIQQILLNSSQQVISVCSDLLWTAIGHKIKSVNNISEFILKLFMAKFSFLKFQSITERSQENSIQDMIQTIQKSFNKSHPQSIEAKLKSCSAFLELFESQATSQSIFELQIVLTVLGFDEIYCQQKNRLQYIVNKLSKMVTKQIERSQTETASTLMIIKILEDEQTMTYLFWKYMSYSTTEQQSSVFIDILVELCNFYSSTFEVSSNPLFKTMFALQNYKYFFNFLLMNFNQQNLLNKNARETFEKISIVLQRFCYSYGEKIWIEENDKKRLDRMVKELEKKKEFVGSLFKANMENINEKICENKE